MYKALNSFTLTTLVMSLTLQVAFAKSPKPQAPTKPGQTGSGAKPDGSAAVHGTNPGAVIAPVRNTPAPVQGVGEGVAPTQRTRFSDPEVRAAVMDEQGKLAALKSLGLTEAEAKALQASPAYANATPDDISALSVLVAQRKADGTPIEARDLVSELETVQGLKGAEGGAEQKALAEKLKTIRAKIDADPEVTRGALAVMGKAKDDASFKAELSKLGLDAAKIEELSVEFTAAKGDAAALAIVREKLEVALYIKRNPNDAQAKDICGGGACPCH